MNFTYTMFDVLYGSGNKQKLFSYAVFTD